MFCVVNGRNKCTEVQINKMKQILIVLLSLHDLMFKEKSFLYCTFLQHLNSPSV